MDYRKSCITCKKIDLNLFNLKFVSDGWFTVPSKTQNMACLMSFDYLIVNYTILHVGSFKAKVINECIIEILLWMFFLKKKTVVYWLDFSVFHG